MSRSSSRRALLALAGVALFPSCSAAQQQRKKKPVAPVPGKRGGKTRVIEIRKHLSLMDGGKSTVEAKPLQRATAQVPTRPIAEAGDAASGVSRHFSSNQLNSRMHARIGSHEGPWVEKWRGGAEGHVSSIVRTPARICAQWPGGWRIYEAKAGTQLASGFSGQSPLWLDIRPGLMHLITGNSNWEVRSLADGALNFRNVLPFQETHAWPLLMRTGRTLLAFAAVTPMFRHGTPEPGSAMVQLLELSPEVATDQGKLVRNLARSEWIELAQADGAKAAASADGSIVIAWENTLLTIGPDLTAKSAFSGGNLRPRLLSIDEAGWAYIESGSSAGGGHEIIAVTPTGSIAWTHPLGMEFGDGIQPPVVGFDHTVYAVSAGRVAAIDGSTGTKLWEKTPAGGVIGASVTADQRLLVTTHRQLLALDSKGASKVLHEVDAGTRITTYPVLTEPLEILIGTEHDVRLLTPAAR